MKKRIGFAVVVAAVALAIFLHSQNQLDNEALKLGYKALPEYSDPSKTVKTAVGAEFIISLDSNRTTGYGWEITGGLDGKTLKLVEVQHRASQTKLIGAGGKDSWTFKALQEGNVTLSLQYVRPWEKNVPPAKVAEFSITITK